MRPSVNLIRSNYVGEFFYNYVFFVEEETKFSKNNRPQEQTRRKYYSVQPVTRWNGKPEIIREMKREEQPDGGYLVRKKMMKNMNFPMQR